MFDPYRKWLGIQPKDQPPNHYRLLSLDLYENDLDVIEGAADRAMAFIRQYQSSEHAALAAKLLSEIATVRLCLLKPASKVEYDARLKSQLAILTPADDDRPLFGDDDEFDDLMKASKSLPRPKPKTAKVQRRSPALKWLKKFDWTYVAAGICVVVILVPVAIFMNAGRDRTPALPPSKPLVTETAQNPPPTQPPPLPPQNPMKITTVPASTAPTPNVPKPGSAGSTVPSKSIEIKLPDDAVGAAVDLIQAVDLKRDEFAGDWKKEGSALVSAAAGKLYLPAKLPDDYQLQFAVRRTAGDAALSLGFVMAGRPGMVAFDADGSKFSYLYLDGQGRDVFLNCTKRPGTLFKNGQLSTIVLDVHARHLKATVDGNVIIDWYGDSDRMYLPSDLGMPNRESPFVIVAAAYQIESAVMIPIKPDPPFTRVTKLDSEIDLMPLIDPARFAVSATPPSDSNVSPSTETFKITGRYSLPLSVPVPLEYTLSMNVEIPPNTAGRQVLVIGLITEKSCCTLPIVQADSDLGLENIDGVRWHGNQSRLRGQFLVPGKPAHLECTVTKQGVRMDIDGRTLINWLGDTRRLTVHPDWSPTDARRFFFGTEMLCNFSNVKLGPPTEAPILPRVEPETSNRVVDLLALIDSKRDALEGTWTEDKTALRVMGDTSVSKLIIPYDVPPEYKLTLRVAREKGDNVENDALVLNLPVQSPLGNVAFDRFASTFSGINIDQLSSNDPNNAASRAGPMIPLGAPKTISVTVRKNGLKVTQGNKEILNWVGNPNRLGMGSEWSTPSGRISLCSWVSRFRFEKIDLEPLEPLDSPPFPPVAEPAPDGNLMSTIDLRRDSRRGQWTSQGDGIVSPPIAGARLTVPVTPPDRYMFTADVERVQGRRHFLLGLIVDGHPCAAVVDGGSDGKESGLERIDDKPFHDVINLTHQASPKALLPKGKRIIVRGYVTPDSIVVTCDDRVVVRWHGDPRRLSMDVSDIPPNYSESDRSQLWLGAWESKLLVRDLNLKTLSDDQAAWVADRVAEGDSSR